MSLSNTEGLSDERLAKLVPQLTENIRLMEHRLAKSAIPEESWETAPALADARLKLALVTELLSRRAANRAGGVEVRKLEWEKSNVADRWTAQYPFGLFEITHYNLDYVWQRGICSERFDTLEAAQAACQADFTQRILSAISLAAEAAPVAWINGEREIMLGWFRRYIDEQYSCGQVDDGMRLERLHKLLSGSPHPSSPVSAEGPDALHTKAADQPEEDAKRIYLAETNRDDWRDRALTAERLLAEARAGLERVMSADMRPIYRGMSTCAERVEIGPAGEIAQTALASINGDPKK